MNIGESIHGFIQSSRRIFIVSKKPTMEEFLQIAKITGIGIIIVGVLGYLIYFIFALLGLGR